MQTCIWPSWCHCHSLSLASVKSTLVLPFLYRLTRVVPEKGPLNGCVCVCLSIFSCTVLFVSISQVIGCEDHLRNDSYCVEWGVILYSYFQLWLWIWWRMVMCCRQVLHNTALQHVRHNRSCIEPCLRQLMISLESLKVFHNVNYTVGS